MRWDIFCTVIDNYGDIGIAWRLARQLVAEHGQSVRLWVDDLASFRHLRPEIDPALAGQSLAGVEVCHWSAEADGCPDDGESADVVIEALACNLPEAYIEAMARRVRSPVWINLEYLSAEDWVTGCHALPSPHPRLPLTKYFFMPGYVAGTGGVLREAWLAPERDAFLADSSARRVFWSGLRVPPPAQGECRFSLFGYETPRVCDLLDTWSAQTSPITCLLPESKLTAAVARHFGRAGLSANEVLERGALRIYGLPMLDQDAYDRLLWACDCNFVRGEDSFVRAQWALRPMVWQAYRQDDAAHWPKIEAFLARYTAGLPAGAAVALAAFWRAWNRGEALADTWPAFWRHAAELNAHARSWATGLEEIGDLASNLAKFCSEKSQ